MGRCRMLLATPATGALLLLSLLAMAPLKLSATKLESSGIHMFVTHGRGEVAVRGDSRQRRDTGESGGEEMVRVQQFHVSSLLYQRFATVTIESQVLNNATEGSQEVSFKVQVPETAFMSNFTMMVGGQQYVAQVLERQAAEERYQQARERNQTAAQVQQDPVKPQRGMEYFTINVNLAAGTSAYFTLAYHDLLVRRGGKYIQRLVVQPGAIVNDLTVRAAFDEQQGFSSFAYMVPGSDVELTASSEENKTQMRATPTERELVFAPTVEMQRSFNPDKGISGEFTILYEVNDEPGGGRIVVQNKYFAHFFAPPNRDPLAKNILFVIDISGSMSGDKIKQVRVAMNWILDDLKTRTSDLFNLLVFNSEVETWRGDPASTLDVDQAKEFVETKVRSGGGTNIHEALMTGLDLFLRGPERGRCEMANIIVFLTDGNPSAGITDIGQIIQAITAKNEDGVSLFSLGFGYDLNFDFLLKLSARNRGSAHRIYPEDDASIQLDAFYKDVRSPLLCDVVARYSTDAVDSNFLTLTNFPLFFEGSEIIVAGKTMVSDDNLDAASMGAELQAIGPQGSVSFVVPAGKVDRITQTDQALTQKLYVYMKIKSLLRKLDKLDSEVEKNETRNKALNLSLTHGFVTPLTSFSIVVEEGGPDDRVMEDAFSAAGFPSGNKQNMGIAGSSSALRWSWGVVGIVLAVLFVLF